MSLPPGLEVCEFSCRAERVKILTCETFQGSVLTESEDLTGFMVWPASHLMCTFICSRPDLLRGKDVIELGSGCGLAGILASRFARSAMLSDMSKQVLALVEANLEERDRSKIQCRELLWGNALHHQALLQEYPAGFDVVLGADIIYPGHSSIERLNALLDTATVLLHADPRATFICAYLSRHQGTDVALADAAAKRGLQWKVTSPGAFIESGDYFPAILNDACIILFAACSSGSGLSQRRNLVDDALPEWSTTLCGRTPSSRSVSPEVWALPGDGVFDDG